MAFQCLHQLNGLQKITTKYNPYKTVPVARSQELSAAWMSVSRNLWWQQAFIALGLHAEIAPGSLGEVKGVGGEPPKTPPKKKVSEPSSSNPDSGAQSPPKDSVAPQRLKQSRPAVFMKAKAENPVLKLPKDQSKAPQVDPEDLAEQEKVGKPSNRGNQKRKAVDDLDPLELGDEDEDRFENRWFFFVSFCIFFC